ncbi:PEP-CTERM sorting domain-containing protein [Calothrix sp. HK-06]|nr:PEP-CTERM sorting domain-containing protein [Calothrix sp. HK-06]
MFIKKALTIAALSAVASLSYAGSAHALGFTYNAGSFRTPGVTSEGSFSNNVNQQGYTTFDFNNGAVPGNDTVKYSFSSAAPLPTPGQTGIYTDQWAPSGVSGEVNKSNYLAVFQGNDAIIQANDGKKFNYFGLNLGALSSGNTLRFFDGANLVKELTYELMTKLAPTAAQQHGGEKNGFFEFFSEGNNDNFDKIVLSQVGGGGFETDNHTFRVGTGKYTSVPEPGIVLGLVGVGGMFLRKRKSQKTA